MNTKSTPCFYIAGTPIYGRMALAPMDGISDASFRWLTRTLGSAWSVTEFINTLDFVNQKTYPYRRMKFREAERPVAIQLLDNNAERIARSAARIEAECKPDFFDLNLGCCAKTVTSRGAGAALMCDRALVEDILRALRSSINTPFTVKMRLGWNEESITYLDFAKLAQDMGASAIALHARTAKMAYSGHARWEHIATLKQAMSIPVIGNGDVCTPEDVQRMLDETGCDGVLIGRAAKANPWIFSGLRRDQLSVEQVEELIKLQFGIMYQEEGERAILPFRKFLKAYLEPYDLPRATLQALLTCNEVEPLLSMIRLIFVNLKIN